MKLRKIISGGQTGADQAGLEAAKSCLLETGGWAPKGWFTEDGPRHGLLKGFGLCECGSGYAERTRLNVKDSDATIRFALDFNSKGERCTKRAIEDFDKLYFDVNLNDPPPPAEVAQWLDENNIEVLNVAGNSQSKSRGLIDIFERTHWFLIQVFACLLDIDLIRSEYFNEDENLDLYLTGQTSGRK
jgi:hypothetical protein